MDLEFKDSLVRSSTISSALVAVAFTAKANLDIGFYTAASQVIPIFMLMLLVEARLYRGLARRSTRVAGLVGYVGGLVMLSGEVAALGVAGGMDISWWSEYATWYAVVLGLISILNLGLRDAFS